MSHDFVAQAAPSSLPLTARRCCVRRLPRDRPLLRTLSQKGMPRNTRSRPVKARIVDGRSRRKRRELQPRLWRQDLEKNVRNLNSRTDLRPSAGIKKTERGASSRVGRGRSVSSWKQTSKPAANDRRMTLQPAKHGAWHYCQRVQTRPLAHARTSRRGLTHDCNRVCRESR